MDSQQQASYALQAALNYAENGWKILPLHSPKGDGCSCGTNCGKIGKHPRVNGWGASTDRDTVEGWFRNWPDANLGLVLEGLAVLDVDLKSGGDKSLAHLESEHGKLPERARQRTGSGGWHYLFSPSEQAQKKELAFRPGLDFLTGPGCYIVVAPSVHACGGPYAWFDQPSPWETSRASIMLPVAPQWLLDALHRRPATKNTKPAVEPTARKPVAQILEKALAMVHAGDGRNNTGFWFFCQLRDELYSKNEAISVRREWHTRANAESADKSPYSAEEVRASLNQAFSRDARKPSRMPDTSGPGIVQDIEKAIKAENHFARDAGDRLYRFEDGVYRPTGQAFVKGAVKAYCEASNRAKSWSPDLAAKVTEYLVVDAPRLLERPPLDTLNVRNGLLDVKTRTLRDHSPEFLSPVQIEAAFDPAARCPAIDLFVSQTFPADSFHVAWQLAAWLALPDTSIQKAALMVGEGANGKSVFLSLLRSFIGRDNVSALSLHKIESDKFAAARLVGKLANICADLPTAALSGTSMFKALTGGDEINAERKFEGSFEFTPYARLIFSANAPPRSDDASPGFFRRWLVVPFNQVFEETSALTISRSVLDARLSTPAELSGLLNHALDALPQIQTGAFLESESLRTAWKDFRRTTDPLAVWLDANTVERTEAFIQKATLRELYLTECRDRGLPSLSPEIFTKRLRSLRPRVESKQRTIRKDFAPWCFVGIGLRSDETEPAQTLF